MQVSRKRFSIAEHPRARIFIHPAPKTHQRLSLTCDSRSVLKMVMLTPRPLRFSQHRKTNCLSSRYSSPFPNHLSLTSPRITLLLRPQNTPPSRVSSTLSNPRSIAQVQPYPIHPSSSMPHTVHPHYLDIPTPRSRYSQL
jgi:hypothetical protein